MAKEGLEGTIKYQGRQAIDQVSDHGDPVKKAAQRRCCGRGRRFANAFSKAAFCAY
jgi:hypothetical protein